MNRAFVRESDEGGVTEGLLERPVSTHPNLVTLDGLKHIDTQLRELDAQRQVARASNDTTALMGIDRDLRYWAHRRATARVVEPAASTESVRFGMRVTLRLDNGGERVFRLVGEDEADPARGLLSWVSPLAQALFGRSEGDTVRFQESEAEILRIEL